MAHGGREIEIKIPLSEEEFHLIRERVRKIAAFSRNSSQSDRYFTPAHRDFVEKEYPFEWLSIRNRAGKTMLNYKHFYPENSGITTHCDEFETAIEEEKQMEKLFGALDFKELVTVEKEREVYVYNEEIEISMDNVKELGFFIEIEALKDFGSVKETKERLFDFAAQLGIDVSAADKRGYPYLLMKKNGLIK